MSYSPVPRTIEQPIKVGFLEVGDWILLLSALLLPQLFNRRLGEFTIGGWTYTAILQIMLIGSALAILKMFKTGKPRGYLLSSLVYWLRPNQYN